MSLKVGELVAYIRADGTEFDRTIDRSGAKFQGFGRLVQSGVQTTARAFAGAVTGAGALTVALLKVGSGYNRLQQSSRAALTTLLGGAEAANAQMDKLDEFARSSPFAKQVFISAQQQLLGFGLQAEKVLPTLDAIQNAVAATGGSNVEIERVTYALAQMQGMGKLSGETLRDLGIYGIDAAGLLGKEFGKTGAEIREMASKPGGIPVEQVWDPLVKALMDRFGGATDNIKMQFDGAADRVKGAWRDIGSVIAAPFIDPKGGGRAVEWVNKVADVMRAAETKARPLVDLLVKRFAPGLDAINPLLERVRGSINAWDLSKLNGQLDTLSKYTAPIAGVSAALFAMGTSNLPILSKLGLTGINPVVAGLAAVVASSPELRTALGSWGTALAPVLPMVQQLAGELGNAAGQALGELIPALAELIEAGGPVAALLLQSLIPALVQVVGAGAPVVSFLADAVKWFAALDAPLQVGIVAFGVAAAVLPRVVAGLTGLAASAAAAGGAMKAAFIGNPLTLVIGAIAGAVGLLASRNAEANERISTLADTLDRQTASITENTRAHVFNKLEQEGVIDTAKALGLNLGVVTDAALGNAKAMKVLRDAQAEADQKTRELAKGGLGAFAEGTAEATRVSGDFSEVLVGVSGMSEDVAEAQGRARDEMAAGIGVTEEATGATTLQADALRELLDAQNEAAGATMSLREAQIQETESREAAAAAAAEGATVARDAAGAVDLNAASTRAADKALLDLAGASTTTTEAMRRNNETAGALDATVRQQRDAFVGAAQQMGYTKAEAERLATAYGLIPRNVVTKITAEAQQAQVAIDNFIRVNDGRRIRVTVDTNAGNTYNYAPGNKFVMSAQARGSLMEFYANGGVRGLKPMSPVGQIVPANTWRVVGDRGDVPEAYIPLDRSVRSLAILDQAADRLGRRVVPMAAGGVTGGGPAASNSRGSSVGLPSTVVLRVGEREFTAYVDERASGILALDKRAAAGTRQTRGALR